MLAVAEPDLLFLGQGELFRAEAGALVRTVTHGLVTAKAAGAPPMVTGFKFQGAGLFVVNFGNGIHGVNDVRPTEGVRSKQSVDG